MANQDRRPPPQPAEGERRGAHQIPHHEPSDAFHQRCEQDAEDEAACGGVGEIPDGDGVRSDLGTNPLPDTYWSAYPGKKPDEG